MPTVIMPKMGDAMEEGTLLRWLKQVGDEVEAGEPIAEIETDKVSLEIEAAESGVLSQILTPEGSTVPIGTAIATIGEEAAAETRAAAAAQSAAAEPAAASAPAPVQAAASANGRAAQPEPVAAAASTASDGAAIPATAEPSTRAPGERLRASPLVKRLAAEHGIDLTGVVGTGPGGRIVRDDIANLLTGAPAAKPAPTPTAQPEQPAAPAPAPAPAQAAPSVGGRPEGVVKEFSRIRRTTGKRMAESKQTAPHFYVTVEVDMAPAVAFRERVNAEVTDGATKISFNDLIVKAAALALRDFPNLNSAYRNDALVEYPSIDVNIAVAIEGGLIAPFIPDADQKSLGAIARLAKDLIGRAREGGLKPEEFEGGTFTISNLGMFDVDEFIAVINPPQAAILAVGSIREMPVAVDGAIEVGRRMKLTLSADHRVTDGAEIARFLGEVKRLLEHPMLMLVG
jgi:pyruvate dehydrogenase E2 component (dihydrolipoyllysine-residue acetyltransferase)